MNKKLKKEIEKMLQEEGFKNVECIQAWTRNCVRKEQLVRAEMERRHEHNHSLEGAMMFFAVSTAVAFFLIAGSFAGDIFVEKLIYGGISAIVGFLMGGVVGYMMMILLSKNTSQKVVEEYVFGGEIR